MREFELPPLWLALFLALGWGGAQIWRLPIWGGEAVGLALVALGVLLMGLAAGQMMLARTTVIPRRDPRALVTGGVFAISRNPIYVADALILAGGLLYWQAGWLLWLVAGFMAVISRRFILGEEARLRAQFGAVYADYCATTRRGL